MSTTRSLHAIVDFIERKLQEASGKELSKQVTILTDALWTIEKWCLRLISRPSPDLPERAYLFLACNALSDAIECLNLYLQRRENSDVVELRRKLAQLRERLRALIKQER